MLVNFDISCCIAKQMLYSGSKKQGLKWYDPVYMQVSSNYLSKWHGVRSASLAFGCDAITLMPGNCLGVTTGKIVKKCA